MSAERSPYDDPIAAVAQAARRADARLVRAAADARLAEDDRIDTRTRVLLDRMIDAAVGAIAEAIAARMGGGVPWADAASRLRRAGLLADAVLFEEAWARARQEVLAASLPIRAGQGARASLLVRLSDAPDAVVSAAARAAMVADNRRRAVMAGEGTAPCDLPAPLHRALVWRVAAAMAGDGDAAPVAAAAAVVAATAADGGAEDAAIRLAAAIAPVAAERAPLLVEALGDGRLVLFAALLANAAAIPFDAMRAAVIDPAGERLWLAMRAADLDRATIARVALALAEADPARDIEAFADTLDAIAAVAPPVAGAAIAPMRVPAPMRAALQTLAEAERAR